MKKTASGISSFEELRKDDEYVYVDKTEYIYPLVSNGINNDYFISRPRGFGTSLMCSTLEALFEGKRELFKGLYIDSMDYPFDKYPVLHFDFSGLETKTYDDFLDSLQMAIISEAERNGLKVGKDAPSSMLRDVLSKAGMKVVIIIDEYDAPLISPHTDIELADRIWNEFLCFYAVIRNDCRIRFCFITGNTMTVFSEMDTLINLTFDPDFASAFGYTAEELEAYFSPYIDDYMSRPDREYETREELLMAVENYYGGYRFSCGSEVRVCNPVSVGMLFRSGCVVELYWVNTVAGAETVNLAAALIPGSIAGENFSLCTYFISFFDYRNLALHATDVSLVINLLFVAGYLTIKDGDAVALTLTFPNMEVRTVFTRSLMEQYAGGENISAYVSTAESALGSCDIPAFVRAVNAFCEKISSTGLSRRIGNLGMLRVFFLPFEGVAVTGDGLYTPGRIDVTITLPGDVYVIEIKVNHSVKKALEQIRNKRYYAKYINTDKRIHIVGLNFTSRSRKISSYREEIIDKTKEPTFLG
jgi:hypothetical protein